MPASTAPRQRLSRRAKLQGVDYAVLASGQQIPEYSSEDDASEDESYSSKRRTKRATTRSDGAANSAEGVSSTKINATTGLSNGVAKRKRKAKVPDDCFICKKESKSPFMQCEICSRWYHYRCWKPFESASVLGNTSCHECVEGHQATKRLNAGKPPPAKQKLASVQDFVTLLKKAKKILVVAGAGMSVSCGIPDFRSKDGIYAMIEHMDTHFPEPECLFQIEYFRQDPSPFFQLVRNVFAHSPAPSKTHRFLKMLQDKKKLLRLYSQNIDGLEEAAGVTKYIPCHGSFAWSSCMRCKYRVATSTLMGVIQAGVIPTCSKDDCCGVLKPEITFFGELLSDHVSTSVTKDRLEADLLLVIGTSLKVSPVAEIPGFLPSHIPQVVINKTALKKKKLKSNNKKQGVASGDDSSGENEFDMTLLGDCDDIVQYVCDLANWDLSGATEERSETEVVTIDSSSEASKDDDDFEPHVSKTQKRHRSQQGKKKRTKSRVIKHANKHNMLCFGECHCANKLNDRHNDDSDQAPDGFVCDGCGEFYNGRASVQAHYSCDECFDFDLCGACYPTKKKHHGHAFTKF